MTDNGPERPPLGALAGYFLLLGSTGFGGPIALVGAMQRDLVERRRWFSSDEFARSLALAQLAPGPLAAQVAFCLGFVHSRLRGAALISLAFILPSFLLTLLLGAIYLRYGGLPWLDSAFYGVGAVVLGIIVISAWRLARTTARADPLLWSIAVVVAGVTAWRARELLWLIGLAGLVGLLSAALPRLRGTTLSVAVLPQLLWYFAKAGSFVFGSGLAIVPFLYAGVVTEHRWLNERQFLDAIAVAMLTPGPVVITVAFIGYLVAGLAGAGAATIGVFLPAFLLAVILFPLLDRFANRPLVVGFVRGVTAAAAGAIAGACIVLGRRAITDVPSAALALVALGLVARTRLPPGVMVLGGAAA
ncbi:MAG TPA: chromate transporter, partial [Gemmatimonadales bacterium]|nr:chromate transporter [Gemmatimonadales bacterium]